MHLLNLTFLIAGLVRLAAGLPAPRASEQGIQRRQFEYGRYSPYVGYGDYPGTGEVEEEEEPVKMVGREILNEGDGKRGAMMAGMGEGETMSEMKRDMVDGDDMMMTMMMVGEEGKMDMKRDGKEDMMIMKMMEEATKEEDEMIMMMMEKENMEKKIKRDDMDDDNMMMKPDRPMSTEVKKMENM